MRLLATRTVMRERLDWQALIEEALTVEGSVTNIYNRFTEYSFGNCMWLRLQGVNEPVNTLKRWNAMNRRVLKGSRAYSIMVPLVSRTHDEDGEVELRTRGFKMSRSSSNCHRPRATTCRLRSRADGAASRR
jgi:hypothetical protein